MSFISEMYCWKSKEIFFKEVSLWKLEGGISLISSQLSKELSDFAKKFTLGIRGRFPVEREVLLMLQSNETLHFP